MKFVNSANWLIGAGACFVLAACASDESINREAKVELAPMAKPAEHIAEARWMNKGELGANELVSVEGDLVTRRNTEGKTKGCTWTSDGWFSPSVKWENCRNGSTGSHEFTKTGDIWPLEVGKTESYKVSGKDQNDTWKTTRNCEVKAAVLVSIADKQYPTYEVVCKNDWQTHTWYVSPELQRKIKYKRRHYKRGLESDSVAVLN
jgi:hypothetical protein